MLGASGTSSERLPVDGLESLSLSDGARIAVMGGGPAGSFFSYFLLVMAERLDLELQLDLFEPRDFCQAGPKSCNMCGGIISESLVQALAAEGINLPSSLVQRGIDAYVLHTEVGTADIDTPLQEKRIAAVFRGAGPRDHPDGPLPSFDGYLQQLARERGACIRMETIESVTWQNQRPRVQPKGGEASTYDLLVVASGVNSSALKAIKELSLSYAPPETVRTAIREYHLGTECIANSLGSAMHVYLLNVPRLEFAAIIPKGSSASVCLLGNNVDRPLVDQFLASDQVRATMPAGWVPSENMCQCSPRMNVRAARQPYADRVVFIGDAGISRLYKDGIGAAYRTAKAAARCVLFHGVSEHALARYYGPTCKAIDDDNRIGRWVYAVAGVFRRWNLATRIMLDMVRREQNRPGPERYMSTVLWDMFTGSAPYGEVLTRGLRPVFLWRLLCSTVRVILRPRASMPGRSQADLQKV